MESLRFIERILQAISIHVRAFSSIIKAQTFFRAAAIFSRLALSAMFS